MKLVYGALLLFIAPECALVEAVSHVRKKAPAREKKAYDTGVRGFSPDGSIYQVEYALQAAAMGGLTIGIQTDQGVVLAAQGKRRSPLLKSSSVSKIAEIDTRMSCAMSGLLPDGRLLIDFARTWVQEHIFEFEEAPSVEAVASQLSTLALKFNGYDKDGKSGSGGRDDDDGGLAMSRPVGVALLMAGIDRGNCPVLFHLDPSGAYVQWRAKAMGEKAPAAEAKLDKCGPFEGMAMRRAMSVVLSILKETLGEDFSTDRLEMVCVDLCEGDSNDEDGDGGSDGGERRFLDLDSGGEGGDSVLASPIKGKVDGQGGSEKVSLPNASSMTSVKSGLGTGDAFRNKRSKASLASQRRGLFRRVSRHEIDDLLATEERRAAALKGRGER